jgi:GMP synthase (glutamine-hydrolysing)
METTLTSILGGKFIDVFEAEAKRIEEASEKSDMPGKIEFFLQ